MASNAGYPLWVAMGAALFGTLLGGGAVYLGLTGSVDPYLNGVGVLSAPTDPAGQTSGAELGDLTPPPVSDPDLATSKDPGEAPSASAPDPAPPGLASLPDAVEATRATVVTLKVGETLNGAGVVFDADGYVFTNFHVVEPLLRGTALSADEKGPTAMARFVNGRELPAQVVAADGSEDIAILKLVPADSAERFASAPIGESSALRVGEPVFAVGSPVGLEHTVSTGIVSALDRTEILANRQIGLIQLDASINVGNSGGPLFNLRGELVGITAARSARAEGIGFAIPIDRIRVFLDTLRTGAWRRSGVVGIQMSLDTNVDDFLTGTDFTTGVFVEQVPDGPAKRAGMQPKDVIVAVKGRRFDELGTDVVARREMGRRIVTRVRGLLPGESVPFTVVRNGESVEIEVQVEAANDVAQVRIDAERLLGLQLEESKGEQGETGNGLLITGIVMDAPIARLTGAARLRGMRLVDIAGIKIGNLDDLGMVVPDLEAMSRSGRQRQLSVTFETRTGKRLTVPGYPLATPSI